MSRMCEAAAAQSNVGMDKYCNSRAIKGGERRAARPRFAIKIRTISRQKITIISRQA